MRITNKYFILMIGLFCFQACSTSPQINEMPLPLDKLVDVMTDAYVAEAAVQNFTVGIKDSITDLYYEQVFVIHEVSRADYEQSLDIVKYHPVVMDTIYSRMTRRLEAYESLDEPEEKKERKLQQ
ncbi:MAG: DUF4296 domain-containing protein [Bacteroidota bacterium]